ncbi:acetyl-CoA acetyltransferase, partial [Clonorchis sinensis]
PHTVRKNKALRNMLRHSVKVANQRHLACVSKFAIVSSRLAKWRKPTASQRCQYRDPTTTTWEKPCGNLCIPLLPVCAAHVVQLKPAPSLESLTDRPVDVVNGCYQSDPNSETKPLSVSPRSPTDGGSARIHSCAPELPPPARSTRSVKPSPSDSLPISPPSSTTPTLQLPQQYLFRPCGGAFGQPCNKPVIAWTPYTRCPRHTFTVPPTEETSPRMSINPVTFSPDDVFIVAARRSPIGRKAGCLSGLAAHELGGQVITAVLEDAVQAVSSATLTKERLIQSLDEVIIGQVFTAAAGQNPARQAAVLAGIPYSVPAWGVNMLCGSGLRTVCLAYDQLKVAKSSSGGWIIAGGQESMSQSPYCIPSNVCLRHRDEQTVCSLPHLDTVKPINTVIQDGLMDAFCGILMGETAEVIAESYKPCTIGTLVPAATVSIAGKRECGTYNEALEVKNRTQQVHGQSRVLTVPAHSTHMLQQYAALFPSSVHNTDLRLSHCVHSLSPRVIIQVVLFAAYSRTPEIRMRTLLGINCVVVLDWNRDAQTTENACCSFILTTCCSTHASEPPTQINYIAIRCRFHGSTAGCRSLWNAYVDSLVRRCLSWSFSEVCKMRTTHLAIESLSDPDVKQVYHSHLMRLLSENTSFSLLPQSNIRNPARCRRLHVCDSATN